MDELPPELIEIIIGRDSNGLWCRYLDHWKANVFLKTLRCINKKFNELIDFHLDLRFMYCLKCKTNHHRAYFRYDDCKKNLIFIKSR